MSVWGTDEDAALAAVERSTPAPRAPAKFSAWSALPRGIAAAGAEVFADFNTARIQPDPPRQSDFLRMPQMQADPLDRQKVGRDMERTARDFAQSLRTEPADASVAEQLLFDGARSLSKAVGAAVALGPVAGAAAFGTSEALSTSDQLQRQGVDAKTARMAGAATGVISAVGVGLPAAGRTLTTTAALVAAGGPASFAAQQALTREILQRGGYQKQAEGYDPFDPVGLAVSTLAPLPFAALGLRGAKMRAQAEMAAGPVPSARTAVAQAVDEVAMPRDLVDAAMVAHQGDRLRAADDAVALMVRSGQDARQVESLAAFVARNGYTEPVAPKPVAGPDPFLTWVRAQGGIDIAEKVDITGEPNGVRANPGGIFRRGGITTDDLASRAAAEGWLLPDQEGDTAAFVDLVKRAVNGDKVLTIQGQAEKAARDYAEAQTAARVADLEDRLRLLGEDPAAARGNPDALEAYLAQNEPRLLRAALDEIAAARALDDDAPGMQAMQERAQAIARDVQDGGRTVDEYAAEVEPLSPAMRRMVQEVIDRDAARPATTAQPARAEAPRGAGAADAASGAADPGRPAAGVEAARLTPGDQVEAAAAPSRMAQLQAERPDMLVMLDGMDQPMRLDEFLAAVRAEADEMQADAPLMQTLAECAIINGP